MQSSPICVDLYTYMAEHREPRVKGHGYGREKRRPDRTLGTRVDDIFEHISRLNSISQQLAAILYLLGDMFVAGNFFW